MRKILAACAVAGALLLATAALAPAADAQETPIGDLRIVHPWLPESAGSNGAAYFTIVNSGTATDRLVAVSTPIAATAAVHETTMDNGVMKMRPVAALEIKQGATIALQQGGLHVMLTGLAHPLKEGERVPLTLTFQRAGTVEVQAEVEGAAAAAAHAAGATRGTPMYQRHGPPRN